MDLCDATTQGSQPGPSTVRHSKPTTLDMVNAASQGSHPAFPQELQELKSPRWSLVSLSVAIQRQKATACSPRHTPLPPPLPHTRSTPLIPPRGAKRNDSYWGRTEGAPDLWKWTICHLPSLRCQTRVSSDWAVRGMPPASRYCVMRM